MCVVEDELGQAGEDDEAGDGDVGLHVFPLPRGQAANNTGVWKKLGSSSRF